MGSGERARCQKGRRGGMGEGIREERQQGWRREKVERGGGFEG